ncbi:HdeD family acid-resistance protein [Pukyongiella litopenaei]|uniref:Acid-resistance membrane protein n=1 Tax=Pukyongiella litopenaei TaxID=2605946 RepID=A0A2S0MPP0_9RHOB|nr:DUF308 domain-containing protein [Pukyongiella litopenaei]AVO37834.1 hypothetical protein C6Y53_09050 [Pukyongiella litopenaei]
MKEWQKWLLLGVASLIFGIIALGNSVLFSLAVATVTGAMFLISGGLQAYAGFTAEGIGSKLFGILLGILMIFLGISFMFHPLQGAISLAMLVLILLAAGGIVRVVLAWRMRETPFFWPMLISGALSILLAGYIWANFATAAPQLLGVLLGIELLFNGSGLIVLAFFLRRGGGEKTDT